jgi:hypothetical protein
MQKNPIGIKTLNEYCFANLLKVSITENHFTLYVA